MTLYICKIKKKDKIMSSVGWQNNDLYKALKTEEAETGLTLAQRNALQDPMGQSTAALAVNSVFGALTMGMNCLMSINPSSSGDGGIDVEASTTAINKFNTLLENFRNAEGEEKKRYAQELKNLALDNIDNKTIRNGYFSQKENITRALG